MTPEELEASLHAAVGRAEASGGAPSDPAGAHLRCWRCSRQAVTVTFGFAVCAQQECLDQAQVRFERTMRKIVADYTRRL